MRALIAAALIMTATGASAAQRFCNDNVPWHVEEIPHGYAIVRMAYAEYCKRDHMSDSLAYQCDGSDGYVLYFEETAEGISVVQDGGQTLLAHCE